MKPTPSRPYPSKPLRIQSLRPRHALKGVVKVYQAIHPAFFSGVCRFYPTCSHYALDAIENHGTLKGSVLTLWRVWRCQPLYPAGYDPVPERGPLVKLLRSSQLLGPGPLDRLAALLMHGWGAMRGHPQKPSREKETQSLKARML